mgnify:CR=1 FL=1
MHYYAQVGNEYYRLFSIREGDGQSNDNDYMKWSLVYDLIGQRKFTKEFTVHPNKIAIKYAGAGYETLCNFGFHHPKQKLVQLLSLNVSDGFAGKKAFQNDGVKKEAFIIPFPDHPLRPFWLASYFTTDGENHIQTIFQEEKLDAILHFAGRFGNFVTLLKFIRPEWEVVGADPTDEKIQWVHPLFALSRNYERDL